MFRPIRRMKRAISEEDAKRLLKFEKRGVFAVNGDDGYPYAVPVNYYYDEEANKIFFHGAKAGHKFESLKKDNKVCFTVYGNETFTEEDWAPYMSSTVVFGRCNLVDDPKITEERVRELAIKYYPTREEVEEEISKDIRAAQLYVIDIEHLTGKRIREK